MIVYEEDFCKRLTHTTENINLFMVEVAKEKEKQYYIYFSSISVIF